MLGLAGFLGVANWEAHREARAEARGTSPERRPVQESAARGAQRASVPQMSLSQEGGCRGRQRVGAQRQEGEPGHEAICRLWLLQPPPPNGHQGR